MITPWLVAIAIALILIKAAKGSQDQANSSRTFEGLTFNVGMATVLAIAALAFILAAVILANS